MDHFDSSVTEHKIGNLRFVATESNYKPRDQRVLIVNFSVTQVILDSGIDQFSYVREVAEELYDQLKIGLNKYD